MSQSKLTVSCQAFIIQAMLSAACPILLQRILIISKRMFLNFERSMRKQANNGWTTSEYLLNNCPSRILASHEVRHLVIIASRHSFAAHPQLG